MSKSAARPWWRRRWALTLMAVVLVMTAVPVWLLNTQSGLRAALALANKLPGLAISHNGLRGDMARLAADRLLVELPTTSLVLRNLELDWRPAGLLRRRLEVKSLAIDTADVTITAAETTTSDDATRGSSDWSLPVGVEVQDLAVGTIDYDGRRLIEQLSLRTQIHREDLAHQINLVLREPQMGDVALSASGDQLRSEIQLQLPEHQAQLDVTLYDWMESLRWTLAARLPNLQSMGTDGALTINGHGDLENAALTVDGRVQDHRFLLDSLTVEKTGPNSAQVGVTGVADGASVELVARLTPTELSDARLQVADYTLPGSTTGRDRHVESMVLTASGPWDELAMAAQGRGVLIEPFAFEFSGQLRPTQVSLNQLRVDVLGGSASGNGRVNWQQALTADFELSARDVDLSRFDPRLPQASANAVVDFVGDRLVVEMRDLNASVAGSDEPIRGTGRLQVDSGALVDAQLQLTAGRDNQVVLRRASPSAAQDLTIDLALGQLGTFVAGAAGATSGQLVVSLSPLTIDGQIELQALRLPGLLSLQQATFRTESLDDSGSASRSWHQRIELTATELKTDRQSIDKIDATVEADASQQRLVLDITQRPEHTLNLTGRSARDGQLWRFVVENLALRTPRAGVRNERPLYLRFDEADGRLAVAPGCLLITPDSGQLCGQLDTAAGEQTAQLNLALAPNAPIVDELVALLGLPRIELVDGAIVDGEISTHSGQLTADVTAELPSLGIVSIDGDRLVVTKLALTAQGSDQTMSFRVDGSLAGGGLAAHGTLSSLLDEPQIDGQFTTNLPRLKELSPLLPAQLLSGELNAQIAVQGLLKQPDITGPLRVEGLQWTLPSLSVTQRGRLQIDFAQTAANGRQVDINGRVESGDGETELTGKLVLDSGLRGEIAVRGAQLLLADSDALALSASPDLTVTITEQGPQVRGELAIDRSFSSLQLPATGNGVTRSADVIIIDEVESAAATAAMPADVDLLLRFARPGKLQGQGLDASISGQLRIRQSPGQPALASGRLSLTGTYEAFGQRLNLEQGRLLYSNSALDAPLIEAFASRQVDDVTVGVRISGRPTALQTTLESSPSLPQGDILHYLVLGRAPGTGSAADSDQLASAALALALRRSAGGVRSIGDQLGATDFGLTQELGGLALAVGKQLSPRLYVGYTVGLLEPIDIATVRYQLNQNWALNAEVSDESRAGVRYKIDRD